MKDRSIQSIYLPVAACLILNAFVPSDTSGQPDYADACRHALMKDIVSSLSTDRQQFSYFSRIDEKTFETLKHDVEAGAAVPIPLLGKMISIIEASASYSDFSEKRREYLR